MGVRTSARLESRARRRTPLETPPGRVESGETDPTPAHRSQHLSTALSIGTQGVTATAHKRLGSHEKPTETRRTRLAAGAARSVVQPDRRRRPSDSSRIRIAGRELSGPPLATTTTPVATPPTNTVSCTLLPPPPRRRRETRSGGTIRARLDTAQPSAHPLDEKSMRLPQRRRTRHPALAVVHWTRKACDDNNQFV